MSGLPSCDSLVVSHGFTQRKPREERNQEQHADDRHIVRLGDDRDGNSGSKMLRTRNRTMPREHDRCRSCSCRTSAGYFSEMSSRIAAAVDQEIRSGQEIDDVFNEFHSLPRVLSIVVRRCRRRGGYARSGSPSGSPPRAAIRRSAARRIEAARSRRRTVRRARANRASLALLTRRISPSVKQRGSGTFMSRQTVWREPCCCRP